MQIVTCRSKLHAGYNFKIHKCNNLTKYCCNSIKMVTSFKYIGVPRDSDLKWFDNKIRRLTVLFYLLI